MNYSIEINQPIKKVYDLYTDRDKLKIWQSMLLNHQLISGKSGEINSVSELACKSVTIFETIVSKNEPFETISKFEHTRNGDIKMFHTAVINFLEIDKNKTLLKMNIDQKVVGFLPKIIMFIMVGSVKKHHQKLLNDFKSFADNE